MAKIKPVFNRAVIKISGEVLAGAGRDSVSAEMLSYVAGEITLAAKSGVETAVVVGGGNFWRGAEERIPFVGRVDSDYVGMLATVMNSILLKNALAETGMSAVVLSRIEVEKIAAKYGVDNAADILAGGECVIIAGGTGNPFFTTDTAAALAAAELGANVLLKATKVDGVYTEDPVGNPAAKKYGILSYEEAINRKLGVMDLTAFSICMENKIKIIVFNLKVKGNLARAMSGEKVGTLVK